MGAIARYTPCTLVNLRTLASQPLTVSDSTRPPRASRSWGSTILTWNTSEKTSSVFLSHNSDVRPDFSLGGSDAGLTWVRPTVAVALTDHIWGRENRIGARTLSFNNGA